MLESVLKMTADLLTKGLVSQVSSSLVVGVC